MSFWLREKEKSAFFGQTRREKENSSSVFVCFFSRRSTARTMNDKDVEKKEPLQSSKRATNREKINLPFRHDGVLRWRASFVLHIEDWKKREMR